MRVGGALDLSDLHQRLVPHALLGVGPVDGVARPVGEREHPPVRAVRVVGDGQRVDALGALFVHPVPQQLRVVPGVQPAERDAGHVRVAEDDVAVEVLAPAAAGGELVADEGGEVAGVVVSLGRFHDLLPGGFDDVEIEQVVRVDESPFAGQHLLEHGTAVRRRRGAPQGDRERMLAHGGVRVVHLLEHAQIGGVVGDGQEVERRLQAHLDAGRVHQGFALGESVGVVGIVPGAEDVRVERVLRVDVDVAEVRVPNRSALNGAGCCRRVAGRVHSVRSATGAGAGEGGRGDDQAASKVPGHVLASHQRIRHSDHAHRHHVAGGGAYRLQGDGPDHVSGSGGAGCYSVARPCRRNVIPYGAEVSATRPSWRWLLSPRRPWSPRNSSGRNSRTCRSASGRQRRP